MKCGAQDSMDASCHPLTPLINTDTTGARHAV